MQLRNFTASEFQQLDPADKRVDHDHARRFALLDIGPRTWGLAWRSDQIEPVLRPTANGVVWIGIDQRLTAVEPVRGAQIASHELIGNLLDITVCRNIVIALVDVEIVVLQSDGSECGAIHIEHLPLRVIESENGVKVELVDGSFVKIV